MFLEYSTDDEVLNASDEMKASLIHRPNISENQINNSKSKYRMRRRPDNQSSKAKADEKQLSIELKMKYATYIDLIPELKSLPYFDLLLVERVKTVKPVRLQEKTQLTGRRYISPYKRAVNIEPETSHATIDSLKRSFSSSNISEASSTDSDSSDSDDEEVHSSVDGIVREFTSTVSAESLKLTIKIHPSPQKVTQKLSTSCKKKRHSLKMRKGSRVSRRLLHRAPEYYHDHHNVKPVFSTKSRLITQKKCACCH